MGGRINFISLVSLTEGRGGHTFAFDPWLSPVNFLASSWPSVARGPRVLPAATRARVEVRAEVEAQAEAVAEAQGVAEAEAEAKAKVKAAAKATAAAKAESVAEAAAEAAAEANELPPPQPYRCAYFACTAAGRQARYFASGWTACSGVAGAGWPSSSSWTDRTSSSWPETRRRPGDG